jgi:hypothetical protein
VRKTSYWRRASPLYDRFTEGMPDLKAAKALLEELTQGVALENLPDGSTRR